MSRHKNASLEQTLDTVRLEEVWQKGINPGRLSVPRKCLQVVKRALENVARSPLTALATLVTMSTSLLVFSLLCVFIENTNRVLAEIQSSVPMRVYIVDGADEQEIAELRQIIESSNLVDQVKFINKQEALKEFQASLGSYSSLLEGLDQENPLPESFEVRFKSEIAGSSELQSFINLVSASPAVDAVHINRGLFDRLDTVISSARKFGVLAVILMLGITAFVIAITILLAVYSHREEISIMQLVGATRLFVRAPYLVEGVLQGLLAGVLAIGLCHLLVIGLNSLMFNSPLLNVLFVRIEPLTWIYSAAVVLLGGVIGLTGSYLAVRQVEYE
ncbi:MAG: ABC transporter permease [Candidatus Dadabacteria bacterium]|nr:MAG: ABC transporter permease [Candidatus Dadabacteria bacterium]